MLWMPKWLRGQKRRAAEQPDRQRIARVEFREFFGFEPPSGPLREKGERSSPEENEKIRRAFILMVGEIRALVLIPPGEQAYIRGTGPHLRVVCQLQRMIQLVLEFYPDDTSELHGFRLSQELRQIQPDGAKVRPPRPQPYWQQLQMLDRRRLPRSQGKLRPAKGRAIAFRRAGCRNK